MFVLSAASTVSVNSEKRDNFWSCWSNASVKYIPSAMKKPWDSSTTCSEGNLISLIYSVYTVVIITNCLNSKETNFFYIKSDFCGWYLHEQIAHISILYSKILSCNNIYFTVFTMENQILCFSSKQIESLCWCKFINRSVCHRKIYNVSRLIQTLKILKCLWKHLGIQIFQSWKTKKN